MPHGTMHRKLYEHVEEALGLQIIQGKYKPRDTLPNEDALCEEFTVSRGVIREAVKVLQKKGLVWPRPKIGTQIQPVTKWNLFDPDVLIWKLKAGQQVGFLRKVTEVRMIIESEAARLAAQRASREEINEIQHLCGQLETVLKDKASFNYAEYLRIDMAFHTAILEAANNELLAQIGRTMRFAVQTARQADIREIEILLASQPYHTAVVAAISRNDPDSAYTASRDMFDQVWANMPDNANGFSSPPIEDATS